MNILESQNGNAGTIVNNSGDNNHFTINNTIVLPASQVEALIKSIESLTIQVSNLQTKMAMIEKSIKTTEGRK